MSLPTARLNDVWSGICCCHPPDPCISMTGRIIKASTDTLSTIQGQGRLLDITIGGCGHTGRLITASTKNFANSIGKTRLNDFVIGCNIGKMIEGNTTHLIGEGGGAPGFPLSVTEFQGREIIHTEVDFGNTDDEPGNDDGYNVYPPVVGTPTAAQIAKSAFLNESPTITEAEDSTANVVAVTPPTSCLDVTEPVPDNFQLSANFTVGDLSTQTAISKNVVRAQHGLTVSDIVCNMQAWAENVGEALSSQFGREEMLITSGFRPGGSVSQHERGQAADLQFPNMTNTEIYNASRYLRDNIPFDQLILEYGGRNPWIHVSFNRAGNRPAIASNKFGTRISPGNYDFGTLRNMA
jgi:hypothetical protein